ncbi:unnamed protein product [Mesocestoides corti]|uniref:Peptidase S1 domain-containing protein n=1 Tax=Mesocestoides corti TaxID=53468 RepID=A0A0R3U5T4_MESCO|nr:unnamed protein product [Mesocestoides corti]
MDSGRGTWTELVWCLSFYLRVLSRIEQDIVPPNTSSAFSLLLLKSSEEIKHFIPHGYPLTSVNSDFKATCKLLAPRHGYTYSFNLQDVELLDTAICSRKYEAPIKENHLCISQRFCLQNALGGILTCTNSTLGFHSEGADCFQGQIGWPVLISVVTDDVREWILQITGKDHGGCGYANNGLFPWFTYFNVSTHKTEFCLGTYVQNDTFPLITSARCLRQCLRINLKQNGCSLEKVWEDQDDADLCAAKNITIRVSNAVSPWRRCLVAHLESSNHKKVLFDRVNLSSFTECRHERFYHPLLADQSLCISAVEGELNCAAWGEVGLVQCQRATDSLWEFIGLTQACPRNSTQKWILRLLEL